MLESSVSFVKSRDNFSAACLLTSAQYPMSKSYSITQILHLASFPVAFAKLRIRLNASWSVQTVNSVPSRRGGRSKVAQTTAKPSRWVMSKLRSRSCKIFWSLSNFLTLSSCFCSNCTHLIWRWHAYVSMVYRLLSGLRPILEERFVPRIKSAMQSALPCLLAQDLLLATCAVFLSKGARCGQN